MKCWKIIESYPSSENGTFDLHFYSLQNDCKTFFYSNIKSSHLVIKIWGVFMPPLAKINDKASKALAVICL